MLLRPHVDLRLQNVEEIGCSVACWLAHRQQGIRAPAITHQSVMQPWRRLRPLPVTAFLLPSSCGVGLTTPLSSQDECRLVCSSTAMATYGRHLARSHQRCCSILNRIRAGLKPLMTYVGTTGPQRCVVSMADKAAIRILTRDTMQAAAWWDESVIMVGWLAGPASGRGLCASRIISTVDPGPLASLP